MGTDFFQRTRLNHHYFLPLTRLTKHTSKTGHQDTWFGAWWQDRAGCPTPFANCFHSLFCPPSRLMWLQFAVWFFDAGVTSIVFLSGSSLCSPDQTLRLIVVHRKLFWLVVGPHGTVRRITVFFLGRRCLEIGFLMASAGFASRDRFGRLRLQRQRLCIRCIILVFLLNHFDYNIFCFQVRKVSVQIQNVVICAIFFLLVVFYFKGGF